VTTTAGILPHFGLEVGDSFDQESVVDNILSLVDFVGLAAGSALAVYGRLNVRD
jgi:hypothetical protein